MTGFSVDVKLKVLIVDEETTPAFEDGKVRVIALCQHVQIIPVSELSFDFNNLPAHLWTPDGVYIGPMTFG